MQNTFAVPKGTNYRYIDDSGKTEVHSIFSIHFRNQIHPMTGILVRTIEMGSPQEEEEQ